MSERSNIFVLTMLHSVIVMLKTNALENISFEAERGDTIAFVGPSGSGKSTLVKLLVGLYNPVSGEIRYDGISSKDIRYNRMRKQLGFVTQDTQLYSGTIRENMQFVKPDATDEEIWTALEKASAVNIVNSSGNGLIVYWVKAEEKYPAEKNNVCLLQGLCCVNHAY